LYKTSYNENTGKICFLNEASYIKIDNKWYYITKSYKLN
jgi:uncharacterized protein YchJ